MTAFTGPSQTALTAAAARAAHLLVDAPPFIFADTMAAALLGDRADELIGYHRAPLGRVPNRTGTSEPDRYRERGVPGARPPGNYAGPAAAKPPERRRAGRSPRPGARF